MSTYYNEFDHFAANWLRNLGEAGHIAKGEADERSIKAVAGADLAGVRRAHFFAGIGGWDLALRLAGWPDDAEAWTGSCPCQPYSSVSKVRRGNNDSRNVWPEFFRLIEERRPSTVFGEQVASPDGETWFHGVRLDLESIGYAVGGANLCSAGVGAPLLSQRLFWVAEAEGVRREQAFRDEPAAESPWEKTGLIMATGENLRGKRWRFKPGVEPLADGFPGRVERLRGYGNAICPQVAAEFIRAYMNTQGIAAPAPEPK